MHSGFISRRLHGANRRCRFGSGTGVMHQPHNPPQSPQYPAAPPGTCTVMGRGCRGRSAPRQAPSRAALPAGIPPACPSPARWQLPARRSRVPLPCSGMRPACRLHARHVHVPLGGATRPRATRQRKDAAAAGPAAPLGRALGLPPGPPLSGAAASRNSWWRENLASDGASSPGAGLFLAEDFRRAERLLCVVLPTASLLSKEHPDPFLSSRGVPTHRPPHSKHCCRQPWDAPQDAPRPLARPPPAQPLLRVTSAPKHEPHSPGCVCSPHLPTIVAHPAGNLSTTPPSPGRGGGCGGAAGLSCRASSTASSRAAAAT